MQNPIDTLQNTDYVILFQPVLVSKQAIQSLSMMPISQPMQLPQPIPVQPIQQEETPALLPPPSANNAKTDEKPRKGMASEKQKNFILEIVTRLNMTKDEMQRELGVRNLEQATNAKANEFITKYKDAKPQF